MSDALFVTLFRLDGWVKERYEVEGYKNQDRPETIKVSGKEYKYVGTPGGDSAVLRNGKVKIKYYTDNPIYAEIKNEKTKNSV